MDGCSAIGNTRGSAYYAELATDIGHMGSVGEVAESDRQSPAKVPFSGSSVTTANTADPRRTAMFRAQIEFCTGLVNRTITTFDEVSDWLNKGAVFAQSIHRGSLSDVRPLNCAALSGNGEAIKAIIGLGKLTAVKEPGEWDIGLDKRDSSGLTPLDMACGGLLTKARFDENIEFDFNQQNGLDAKPGQSNFYRSNFEEKNRAARCEGVLALLEAGAISGCNDENKNPTPIHYAAEHGFTGLIRLLARKGFDINDCSNRLGQSPLHIAAYVGQAESVETLLALGASVNTVDINLQTPLHRVCLSRDDSPAHARIAGLLLDSGADAALKDKKARHKPAGTPFELAARYGRTTLFTFIAQNHADLLRDPVERKRLLDAAQANVGSGRKSYISQQKFDELSRLLDSLKVAP